MIEGIIEANEKILRALYSSIPCCGCCNGDDEYRQKTIGDVIRAMGYEVESIKVQYKASRLMASFSVPALDLKPDEIANLFGRHLEEAEFNTLTLGSEIEP